MRMHRLRDDKFTVIPPEFAENSLVMTL